jgi:hypothetical protein
MIASATNPGAAATQTRLDLAQIVDLVDRLELILHALDRHILRALETLCLDHLGESAFALFRYQAVLWRAERTGVAVQCQRDGESRQQIEMNLRNSVCYFIHHCQKNMKDRREN